MSCSKTQPKISDNNKRLLENMFDGRRISNFYLLANDGSIVGKNGKKFTNSCFSISVLDFLTFVLGSEVNISDIRELGSFGDNEMLDTCFPKHVDFIIRVAKFYNLRIYLCVDVLIDDKHFLAFPENPVQGETVFGEKSGQKITIVNKPSHYELCLSETPYTPSLMDLANFDKMSQNNRSLYSVVNGDVFFVPIIDGNKNFQFDEHEHSKVQQSGNSKKADELATSIQKSKDLVNEMILKNDFSCVADLYEQIEALSNELDKLVIKTQ